MCWLTAENMRREGYEFSVSPPSVLYRKINGQRYEPIEEVVCEVDDTHAGSVMQALSLRRAELQEMVPLQVSRLCRIFEYKLSQLKRLLARLGEEI